MRRATATSDLTVSPAADRSLQATDARVRLAGAGPVALLLVAVAGASWAITADRMQGMDMGPGTDLGGLGWFAVVWVTMMAAMMLPSLVPMSAVHLQTGRSRRGRSPIVAACVFGVGYLAIWAFAGVIAWLLFEGARALDASWLAWDQGGRYVAGGVIVAAAIYELTPVKGASLSRCRVPELLAERWRPGAGGALRTGVEHGGFCVGSSWALMATLFALGVMNVAWMVVVAALVAVEKLLPWERGAVWGTAALVGLLGVAVALVPGQVPWLTMPM
jgi:predicted metal-binding membrane protein